MRVAALAAASPGTGLAVAASGSGTRAPAASADAPGSPSYSYYRSMMSSYYGGSSMMGGSGNYQWMADPGLTEPATSAARSLAGHLTDLARRGQADGSFRADADPEAAAWMLLSVMSVRPWRTAVMPGPGRLEGDVADLALQALVPPGEHRQHH